MELISMLVMTGIVLMGGFYLLQVIIGKRKPGNYDGLDGISRFGAMLVIMIVCSLLFKEFVDKQTIKEYSTISTLFLCLFIWIVLRLLVFGKEDQQNEQPKLENTVNSPKYNVNSTNESKSTERQYQSKVGNEHNKNELVKKQPPTFTYSANSNLSPPQRIGRFIVQDGTAIDTETGLMWLRFTYGQNWITGASSEKERGLQMREQETKNKRWDVGQMSWNAAVDAVKKFNDQGGYAGYTDWRLPTLDELKTLTYKKQGKENKAEYDIYYAVFLDWHSLGFWSSSLEKLYGGRVIKAWRLDIGRGGWFAESIDCAFNYVRFVRDS